MSALSPEALAVVAGRHSDPFRYLGPHRINGGLMIRALLPSAQEVRVVKPDGTEHALKPLHEAGLFEGRVPEPIDEYRFRARFGDVVAEIDDAYRFPPVISDFDLYLLGEGTHRHAYDVLGAHPRQIDGVDGVTFAVFAPNAERVSVVGDFNHWDGRRHAMRVRGNGFWEIFIPGAKAGQKYKYEIVGPGGEMLPLKSDPFAFAAEVRPSTASIIVDLKALPRANAGLPDLNRRDRPISIYEVHLGSWRRAEDNRWLTYRELAEQLPAYAADMGFTHVELLPVMEHPFDGSWGYQPTGLYAPTSRFGPPEDFVAFVDACHAAGLGVILDWVPGHFPDDPHGLGWFDGTGLYEHADPRQGRHLDWGTLIYNYGRREVVNFLLANAIFWLDRYGIDGLRVDAVASMLYLDYSRPQGGWVPNAHGGRENLDAIAFLRQVNTAVFGDFPHSTTMAEESTAWPLVSQPVEMGGLGFGFKWNMGWMHDSLHYISRDPIHRSHHHGEILFGLHYAFSENFVLPLSHDEVVHGKASLLGRMPGDQWRRFANMRAYFGFMYGHPGKKLLFMGGEFAQEREWNHDQSLDWHLLDQPEHRGIQNLLRDLNHLYRELPALHELDCEASGFQWLITDDSAHSVFAWLRRGRKVEDVCLVVVNFTPEIWHDYRVPVPATGSWRERLNTDSAFYGGSNCGNAGVVVTQDGEYGPELRLEIPPLAALFFMPG
ncbi:1,4-alpha-glucan branching protein GlgB [uncultured Ferrovibrio sp.]|jgi:1,4-alpha-glucan branching enzyme|uniref:1,4-alpha-glucan branching protein GlgB n=1 Tax=uncultured Ferrovibrio sp. TaxID=1576913 RepID=UPI002627A894|nr:1,4-alpha-glucan branching protein GlgB [uncultured Ferrovibrio sp.]